MSSKKDSPIRHEPRRIREDVDPVTDYERALAASIRVIVDKKRGVKTPQWVRDLAAKAS
ncbi:hypothetical protein NY547_00050 [Cnuibacter physcomitrellae]|uniref:hypothetical protein n=1 Tax=Cnuibacter physcomitrellae TaxID=1619308 RepID=UPI002175A2AA|nr:hypothetical protein [Cnuibacter physcomitrellae]MCS5495628.1 hypothetical protein [Cnuibacter physcomitrellae]